MTVKLPLTPGSTRKDYPLYSGLLSYFPNALAYVSHVSKVANDQHNPGEPLHWAREKSTDHADCLLRHLLNKGGVDEDGVRETGKVAWRALALLEEELEQPGKASEYDWSAVNKGVRYMATITCDDRVGTFSADYKPSEVYWTNIEARPSNV